MTTPQFSPDLHLSSGMTPEGRRTIEPERPERYQRALGRASQQDRLFFLAHPRREEYVRRYYVGEFFPLLPTNVRRVRVTQLAVGIRVRTPIVIERGR